MDLSDKMKKEAVSLGLCAQWTAEWANNTDKDALVEKYVNGIDFCIANDWPSVDEMKRYFDGVMQRHGVYADEHVVVTNPRIAILNGHSDARISMDRHGAATIYVRHKSCLTLTAKGLSKAFVHIYDGAEVSVDCQEHAKCFVYQHGGDVQPKGNVIVRDKRGK